jgi:hypothetical protein
MAHFSKLTPNKLEYTIFNRAPKHESLVQLQGGTRLHDASRFSRQLQASTTEVLKGSKCYPGTFQAPSMRFPDALNSRRSKYSSMKGMTVWNLFISFQIDFFPAEENQYIHVLGNVLGNVLGYPESRNMLLSN